MTDQKFALGKRNARRWGAAIAAVGLVTGVILPTGPSLGAETGSHASGWDCSAGYVNVTFDDGPNVFNEDRTGWILDTLRDYGVHATFFVLGERVADPNQPTRPDLVLREATEGHTVANHSWDHPDLTKLSTSDVQLQLSRDNDAIIAAGAPRPTFFRPPYGYTNANVEAVGESLGLRQVIWDVNKGDTAATSTSGVSDPVLAAVRPGSVIVLHDWAPYTAEALPTILDGLKARNLCPGLLSRTDTYNAQLRSYVSVVPDPNGPHDSTPRQCPCSVFTPLQAPNLQASSATGPHELGMRFAADVPGTITAVRFYKAAANTGPHPVRLWSSGGQLLGSGSAQSETSSGWQQVDIPGGVHVQAATQYIASYSAPAGRFAQDANFFTTAAGSSPIRGLASASGAANGVYATAAGAFPNHTYAASNYWVDVVFVPDPSTPAGSAVDDVGSTAFETALSVPAPGVLSNDVGSGWAVSAWSQPQHGSVTMTGSGGYTYTPEAGFSGPDAFTYTVTDTAGSTASATVRITVSAGPVVARDTFTRSVTGGWGTADLGGAWTPTNSVLSVDGQRGVLGLSAGQSRQVFLNSVSKRDTDTTASVRLDTAPGGSGAYASVVARRVAPAVEYRGTARVQANGSVSALIYRMNGSQPETVIGQEVVVPGLSGAPGSTLSLRLRVAGTSPTTLSFTVWQSGSSEPSPQVTASDSTAALQTAGVPGITASLSSRSGPTVVRFSIDDVVLR
jgi:peptidoglycan/xylan/chitin deacetylase (PgdA/CDA1 family)